MGFIFRALPIFGSSQLHDVCWSTFTKAELITLYGILGDTKMKLTATGSTFYADFEAVFWFSLAHYKFL